jgi:hypothetical protein
MITFMVLSWLGFLVALILGTIVARLPKGNFAGVAAGTGVAFLFHLVFSALFGFFSMLLPLDQIEFWITHKILGMS